MRNGARHGEFHSLLLLFFFRSKLFSQKHQHSSPPSLQSTHLLPALLLRYKGGGTTAAVQSSARSGLNFVSVRVAHRGHCPLFLEVFYSSLRLILDPLDFTHWTCGRAMARSLLPCLLLLALAQTVSDSAHGTHGGVGLC